MGEHPCGSDCKESACNAGDLGSIPRSGRSPGEGSGNPLQYSGLENPMDEEPALKGSSQARPDIWWPSLQQRGGRWLVPRGTVGPESRPSLPGGLLQCWAGG